MHRRSLWLWLTPVVGCLPAPRALPSGAVLERRLETPTADAHLRVPTEPVRDALPGVTIDPSNGLSPDEAALLAVAVNPSLQAIRDQRGIAHSQVVQAGILPNPTLAANVGLPVSGPTSGTQLGYGESLSWNLTPLLSRGSAVEAAKLGVEAVELDVAWQEWQVAQAARLQAARLVFVGRRLEIATKSVEAFEGRVALLQTAVEEGNATILQLSAAQSALQAATLTKLQTKQEQRVTRLNLLATLGVSPTSDLDADPHARLPTWTKLPGLEEIIATLPDQRLDLRGLARGFDSQNANVRAEALRRFPPLSVGIGHSVDNSGLGALGFSISLDLPVFNRNQGQVALATATQTQLSDQYVGRVQLARFDVALALANLESVREQLDIVREAVPTLEHLVDLAEQQVGQGNVSLVDLYDLQIRLLARQLTLQQLLQSELELGISLDIAAGRILADATEAA